MDKVVFFGTDLHSEPTELASKTVSQIKPFIKNSVILSIQNRKKKEHSSNKYIIPKLTNLRILRTIFQSFLIPFYFIFLRLLGYNKIASFWTVNNAYHSLLFKYLKILKFKIIFTIISGYDKNYSSLKYCDIIICQSEMMLSFIKNKFPNKKTELIYPGVDLSVFKPAKKNNLLIVPSVPYKINLFHERRTENMISFLKSNPNIDYTIITRSNESAEYISRILPKEKIISKVLSNSDLSKIMSKAKLIPLLYKESPDMPLSAIEGMASGCAIICSDNMGISEIVRKNKCGFVYSASEKNLKKSDVLKIFSNQKYNKNARQVAIKLFNLKLTIKQYVSLLNKKD